MGIALTDQQQAVVAHDMGPALVFAVAGAGKTTAMVHRIERLVREGHFAPQRIVATSFGKHNENDLRRALAQWPHCQPVQTSTLHALGYDIVRSAWTDGLLPAPGHDVRLDGLDQRILNLALAEARQRKVAYQHELNGLDRADFLDYIGHCKSNLRYADLSAVQLPAAAAHLAQQAAAPGAQLEWYLPFYQLYEAIRRKHGWVTFDDMLLTGWELLQRHADLRARFQQRYDCVLVDEFQDINLAQSEILDALTAPHRNYMAIGDDDQTIYEWRGAHPRFILDFPQRYQARTYLISDNFRCPAAPLVLANHVIRRNLQRQPKQLHLTRGFDGITRLTLDRTLDEMAHGIVSEIGTQHAQGRRYGEMAVLVRLNAQTPPIEQKLIAGDIPYRVSKPFYERPEIAVLIAYCRLAWFERRLAAGELLTGRQAEIWEEAWLLAHNRPKRYLSREVRMGVAHEVLRHGRPLAYTLSAVASRVSRDYLAAKLETLAAALSDLSMRLDDDAHAVLGWLDTTLGYQAFLRESTGAPQIGEGRAVSAAAFIDYARDKGSLTAFLQHIRTLAAQKIGRDRSAGDDAVTLTTIHQAKGLEWPIVFVPNCNHGILPFTETFAAHLNWDAHIEEERRLFYVALTRTREQLHLHALRDEEHSPFVLESRYDYTLATLDRLQSALQRDTADWLALGARAARDAQTVIEKVHALGLERFFDLYWPDATRRTVIGHFARAVQAQGVADAFGLNREVLAFWVQITPEPANLDFPGVARLLTLNGQHAPAD